MSDNWKRRVVSRKAEELGITLSRDHWTVIRAAKTYCRENNGKLNFDDLLKKLAISRIGIGPEKLASLFRSQGDLNLVDTIKLLAESLEGKK